MLYYFKVWEEIIEIIENVQQSCLLRIWIQWRQKTVYHQVWCLSPSVEKLLKNILQEEWKWSQSEGLRNKRGEWREEWTCG